jgi:hypothetical protein
MNGKSHESLLESAVPPQLLTPDLKNSLRKAGAQIDKLGLIDPQTNEIYLNEKNIRDALRNLASESAVQRLLDRLKTSPDANRLVAAHDIARKKLQPIAMLELASKVPNFQPLSDFTYQSLGVNERSSEDEIKNALKGRFPVITDMWFDVETLKQKISQALEKPSAAGGITPQASVGDVIACWGRYFPFWVVLTITSVLGVYMGLIAISAGGFIAVLGIIFALLSAASFGAGTINIIVRCIENPSS